MTLDLISITGFSLALISIIIVIWDHFKDDRILSKQVQEFYQDIENLIFYFYKGKQTTQFDVYEMQRRYYEAKVDQNFEDNSKYLGLVRVSGEFKSREYQGYLNNSTTILISEGRLDYKNPGSVQQTVIQDYEKINDGHINTITTYLKGLRDYWNINYHKFFFRPKIKSKLDFKDI